MEKAIAVRKTQLIKALKIVPYLTGDEVFPKSY